jgi:DNA-binding FadR family transcriptional regulator
MSKGRGIHAQTVERIASWITTKRYGVGDNLPIEPAICAELGVSRTVVREAIKTLVAKGLVSTGPRIGTRVLDPTSWNLFDPRVIDWRLETGVDTAFIDDLIELRIAIEPAAATIAAERADSADRARMLARYAALEASVDDVDFRETYLAADLAYHTEILHITRNQFFVSLAPMLASVLRGSFRLSVKSRDFIRHSMPYHRDIAHAIAAGEGTRAADVLRVLITQARLDILADTDGVLPAAKPARKGAA